MEKVIIMGAAGRDFHNFNVYFRANERYRVVAFTATQIPAIEGRVYPPELCGTHYPDGIPIYPEEALLELIERHQVDLVVFSYSDVSHDFVMHKASKVMAHGADFMLVGASYTMLRSRKPVISVCAVRTGCGKSQTTMAVCRIIQKMGKKVVAVRHPMPYGDLSRQVVQRFASLEDLNRHQCTIEEREEYEPLISAQITVFAGVDYGLILEAAEKEADIIVWDGGNNDTPFYHPDIQIVLFDPHRAGHECAYYPGETNMLMADIAIINKVDSAEPEQVRKVRRNIEKFAPQAEIVLAESAVKVESPERIKGKRVLIVEDGPTLTHGGMPFGAGSIAAQKYEAGAIVDPRPYATLSMQKVYAQYPHIGALLPAMGYHQSQMEGLAETIRRVPCDLVLFATPIDLPRLIRIEQPTLRVRYTYQDHSEPFLENLLRKRLEN